VLRRPAAQALRVVRKIGFSGSADFWERNYAAGGTSGPGSYGEFAEFKADVLNSFVQDNLVTSVIEFGCGDGNQLSLLRFQKYIGLDVSRSVLRRCKERFANDPSKSFFLYDQFCFVDHGEVFRAELGLSLEVVFHLVEDDVFHQYMSHLFSSATRYVSVFSSDTDAQISRTPEVRHRRFTTWVERHAPDWQLVETVPHPHPWDPATSTGSVSDFFFFARANGGGAVL
jgi:SAM-dependent methyltransferase